MSRRHFFSRAPTIVALHRKGTRFVALARPPTPPFNRAHVRGYGMTEISALQGLFQEWNRQFKSAQARIPQVRVIPAETNIEHYHEDTVLAAELDAVLLGHGVEQQEQLLVRLTRDGKLDLSAVRWEDCSLLVDGKRISFERRHLRQIASCDISQKTTEKVWVAGRYARERSLLSLARRAAIISAVTAKGFPALGKAEEWDQDGVTIVLACTSPDSPWGRALRIRYFWDSTADICRIGYRVAASRTDPDRAAIVAMLSPWTIIARHGLDLRAVRKMGAAARQTQLRNEFWNRINPALPDPFAYSGHWLVTAPAALLPSAIADRIEAVLEDLIVVNGPYSVSEVTVRYAIEFFPEPRPRLLSLSYPLASLRRILERALRDILSTSQLAPMGRFIPIDEQRAAFRLSDWCQTTETRALNISTVLTAHRSLLAERRLAMIGQLPHSDGREA